MQENEPPNRYQIPGCSICHEVLKEQLYSLSCGHVFHLHCITQQFQYKGVCPNCQKRACSKQLRKIIFPLQLVGSSADREVDRILSSLDHPEKNQFNAIVNQMRKATQARQKAQRECIDIQKVKSKQENEIKTLKSKNQNSQKQLQLVKRQRHQLRKRFNQSQEEKLRLNKQLHTFLEQLGEYKRKQAKFSKFEQAQQLVKKSSTDIVEMKAQLEAQQTDPKKIAQTFYQMVLIKNNEIRKWKEKSKQIPSKIQELRAQIQRQKDNNKKYKNDYNRTLNQKQKYRMKYEQLKIRYKQLKQKTRKEGLNDDADDDFSIGFSGNSKKNIHPLAPNDSADQIPVLLAQKKTPSTQIGGFVGIANLNKKSNVANKITTTIYGGFSIGIKK